MIFEESHFRDQTSHAGARGLMQITPATAAFIARDSGGTAFAQADLATPQVNISYGAYYLRYLLRRYDGDVTLAVAAYNAGETNVNKWVEQAGGRDSFDDEDDVPFKETRDYVRDVKQKRQAVPRPLQGRAGAELAVVPEQVGSSGPPWRLRAAKQPSLQGGTG